MSTTLRTAVAAAVSPSVRTRIIRAASMAGIELACVEADGCAALNALNDLRPDLLIADVHLPILDGNSLAMQALCSFTLPVRPSVLLLHHRQYSLPRQDELLSAGACLLERNAQSDEIVHALQTLLCTKPAFPRAMARRADNLLDALGFPRHPGRDCLKFAALLCAGNERLIHSLYSDLYPQLGSLCSLSSAQVERAMRHAIDLAWRSNKFENQYCIFKDTVDAGRGQPTCSEMISRLADILRLEG